MSSLSKIDWRTYTAAEEREQAPRHLYAGATPGYDIEYTGPVERDDL